MKHLRAMLILLSLLMIVGCVLAPKPDATATVEAARAATQTAMPTNTPPPTPTATPTSTATSTPTATPTLTATPKPTTTPKPTQTTTPTLIPAPTSSMVKSELESGDTLYEFPGEGFSIVLSPDWQAIDLNKMDLAEILARVGEQNKDLKGILSSEYVQGLVAAGIKLYAINVSQESLASDLPATINVLKQELPFKPTLEMYATLCISQLKQAFDLTSEIEQEQITLGDTQAVKISYTVRLVGTFGQTIEAANTQYLILQDSLAYVVTLSTSVELADSQPSFSEAVETFRLTE